VENKMLEDMAMAWRPNPTESNYEITAIDGEVPRELNGILYRNGPNQFVLPEAGYRALSMFDGDGLVQSFQFDDGNVRDFGRYVLTPGFLREKERGKYFGGTTVRRSIWARTGGRLSG
jgi:all-trans-8'-apo-beta-carotenal 15,15'-oxygenase